MQVNEKHLKEWLPNFQMKTNEQMLAEQLLQVPRKKKLKLDYMGQMTKRANTPNSNHNFPNRRKYYFHAAHNYYNFDALRIQTLVRIYKIAVFPFSWLFSIFSKRVCTSGLNHKRKQSIGIRKKNQKDSDRHWRSTYKRPTTDRMR